MLCAVPRELSLPGYCQGGDGHWNTGDTKTGTGTQILTCTLKRCQRTQAARTLPVKRSAVGCVSVCIQVHLCSRTCVGLFEPNIPVFVREDKGASLQEGSDQHAVHCALTGTSKDWIMEPIFSLLLLINNSA